MIVSGNIYNNIWHGINKRFGAVGNLSVLGNGVDSVRLETRPIPKLEAKDVLLSMKSVMISECDIPCLKESGLADTVYDGATVLGREACGVVQQVGREVTHLKKGDRVSVLYFCNPLPKNGSLCKLYSIDADFCYTLPNKISYEEGALLIPLAIGIYACRRIALTNESKVLIWGAEPIGLVALLVAKYMGVDQIAVADLYEKRLNVAKTLGADGVFQIESLAEEKETVEQIKTTFFQDLRIIECSMLKYVDIDEIYRYTDCFSKAIELMSSGKIDMRGLITHRFELEQSIDAFRILEDPENGAMKILISC